MTFWSAVRTGEGYTIYFTGSAPQSLRFHLLGAAPSEKLLLRIYFGTTSRLQVYVGISRFSPFTFGTAYYRQEGSALVSLWNKQHQYANTFRIVQIMNH